MTIFHYGKDILSVDLAMKILSGELKAEIADDTKKKINACRDIVEEIAASDKAIYGINTGFGPLCDTQISPEETSVLQHNLLLSHAVGVGLPIKKSLC